MVLVWEWPNLDTCLAEFVFWYNYHLANNVFRLFVLIEETYCYYRETIDS